MKIVVDTQNEPERYWGKFYSNRNAPSIGRYPTEWVVRTLAGGNYPDIKIDKNHYRGSRILDMGCGDGRNLPLLLDLGFDVHACEISQDIVGSLEALAENLHWPVNFSVGQNNRLSYPNCYFDYMLCCSSCYYLNGSTTWGEVLTEFARVIKPGGLLIVNFPDEDNAVLGNSIRQPDGSLLITSDPFSLRNGSRFVVPNTTEDISSLLSPQFNVLATGHQKDNYYGLHVSGYLAVAQRTAI